MKICNLILKPLINIVLILSLWACTNNSNNVDADTDVKGKLIIFHAGSLAVPVKQVSEAFNAKYPHVQILTEAAGSVACARKITDLGKACDVFISADYFIINTMLIPEYASWNIKFAGNEMALVFNNKSKYANQINSENWYEILLRDDVRYGRSDPNSDPCGYRTVFTAKLAEKYYRKNMLANDILNRHKKYIRPKEVDLLALLETNTVDYIFIYKSVAVQHKLNYISLPDEINLKNELFSDVYATVDVQIYGNKPNHTQTIKGDIMAYGITILNNAPNQKAALAFVNFLLSPEGVSIIEKNGQSSLLPSYSDTYNNIPEHLQKYVLNKN